MALFSTQIEKHSLAGLFQNPAVLADIDAFLSERDFYVEPHNVIFSCLRQIILANERPDKVLLAQKIKNLGISFKENINIFDYVEAITFAPITAKSSIEACQEVAKLSALRRIETTTAEIKSHINKAVNEPLEKTIGEIDAIYGDTIRSFNVEVGCKGLFDDLLDLAEERGNNPINEIGLSTPYTEFNRLYGGLRDKNLYLIASRAKSGKALEENTEIPTPEGFTKIKDLKVGDEIFAVDGSITKVKNIAFWQNRHLFKATTCDGHFVLCDENHDWLIKKRADYEWEILDTKSLHIYNKNQKNNKRPQTPSLPLGQTLKLSAKSLLIDPYILGLWLGDGTSAVPEITTADDFILKKWEKFGIKNNLKMGKRGEYSYRLTANWKGNFALDALRALKLIKNKHIPSDYLRSSTKQRLKLLQGLIDSDGYISPKNGRIEFSNKNEKLSYDVLELIHSLGLKASIRKNRATLYGKDCGFRYRICFFSKNAACLPRKKKNSSVRKEKYSNRHIKVEPYGIGNTVCIEIEHPSHIFLCGRSMIPTHNSTFLGEICSDMSKIHKIPVLYLDTEMSTEEIKFRTMAAKTGVPLWYIETGNWRKNKVFVDKIRLHLHEIGQNYKVDHYHIGNKKIEEVASLARRWYLKKVGRGNKCLICFDYIKMIDKLSHNQQEYQAMGDKVDLLKKLSEELCCPVVSAVQSNRTGITTGKSMIDVADDEGVVGVSDRITWYASYVGILRRKVPEEIVLDTEISGTHLLREAVARFQGRDATGHQDLIMRTFPNGDKKYIKNYINFQIENFNVNERGSLIHSIERQNAQFKLVDPHHGHDHTL